jgi:hypothetical protein
MEELPRNVQMAIEDSIPYPARDVRMACGLVLVLIDPDHYLTDPEYKKQRKTVSPALRNLWAFGEDGRKVWEAEMPEPDDYYYEILQSPALAADSFSGYTCELDPTDGRILCRTFHK